MNALISKHKSRFMDRRLSRPSVMDPNEKDWITCNSIVMSWILNSLNEELYESLVSQGIWKKLESVFLKKVDPTFKN